MQAEPVDPAVQAGLEHVVDRLCEEFGEMQSRDTIVQVVMELQESLVPYRVGLYVPLLVHRFARQRLHQSQSGETT